MSTIKLALTICLVSFFPLAQADVDIAFYQQDEEGLSLYSTIPLNAIHRVTFCPEQMTEAVSCRTLKRSDFKLAEQIDFIMADKEVLHFRTSRHIKSLIKWNRGIAVINAEHVVSLPDSYLAVTRKKRYRIKSCVGIEGINLDLFDGKRKIGNLYFYLGYDTMATCESAGIGNNIGQ